jgi:hypothetical protein
MSLRSNSPQLARLNVTVEWPVGYVGVTTSIDAPCAASANPWS